MKEIISVNFEEIYLKGDNQSFFADLLRKQLKQKLAAFKDKLHFAQRHGGSLFIEVREDLPDEAWAEIRKILKKTPGITGFYRAKVVPNVPEIIAREAVETAKGKIENHRTFRVTAKRVDKRVAFTSRELAGLVGAELMKEFGTKVDLTSPEYTLYVKVRKEGTLLYDQIEEGMGGLPVGSSGRAVALLSGGIDSPVAAAMAMNRGLETVAVHFHSVPKTSPQSIEKVRQLAGKLAEIQPEITLYIVSVLPIQQEIAARTDSKLRLILLRRFMYLIATEIARRENAQTLVTGDSLGQVASQTVENLRAIGQVTDLFLFRPLIALDKKFIIAKAREWETYDISILPHDDACALFTPKRPETRAKLDYVEKEWKRLDVENLMANALKDMKKEEIRR